MSDFASDSPLEQTPREEQFTQLDGLVLNSSSRPLPDIRKDCFESGVQSMSNGR